MTLSVSPIVSVLHYGCWTQLILHWMEFMSSVKFKSDCAACRLLVVINGSNVLFLGETVALNGQNLELLSLV